MIATGITAAAAATAIYWSARHAWWKPSAPWARPRVLMYHMVRDHIPGARFNKLRVPPRAFEQQIEWLASHGFTFIFASELFAPTPPPEKSVCITFDDGYADNLTAAHPIIERLNARATLYLVEDLSAGWSSKKKAHHPDDELDAEPKLSDTDVRTLLDSGRWELGAHTRTHANLTALTHDDARDEIASALTAFPQRFSATPRTFAYPFGLYTDAHAQLVKQAGYAGAVTTDPGIPLPNTDPMRTPRVKVSGREGLFDFATRVRTGKRGLRK